MTFENLDREHLNRLQWFQEHAGQTMGWPKPLDDGSILASRAKGIYKPANLPFALSIRLSPDGPYADGEVEIRGDGTWSLRYSQEEPGNLDPSEHFTNKGLERCIEQGVPVGVYRKLLVPGNRFKQYEVIGLALPVSWTHGFLGPISLTMQNPFRAVGSIESVVDARKRVLREIAARHGQPAFRGRLLTEYQFTCALTGCSTTEALEAAHIRPYMGPLSNTLMNGILFRSDVHTLFDLRLFGIEPISRTAQLSAKLQRSDYKELHGTRITEPISPSARPTMSILQAAWAEFQLAAK